MKVSIVADIQTVSIAIASASVVAGIVYYALQLRNQTKMRHTDLAMRISAWWTTEETLKQWLRTMDLEFKDFEDFTKKYGNILSEKPEQMAIIITMDHFDAVGYLLHRNMIDYGLVRLMPIVATWEKVKPLVEGLRKRQSGQYRRPYMIWFEYLNNEVKKREQ
jgi:hypothetical protein